MTGNTDAELVEMVDRALALYAQSDHRGAAPGAQDEDWEPAVDEARALVEQVQKMSARGLPAALAKLRLYRYLVGGGIRDPEFSAPLLDDAIRTIEEVDGKLEEVERQVAEVRRILRGEDTRAPGQSPGADGSKCG